MAAEPQTQNAHAPRSGAAARAVYLLGLALLVGSASSPAMAAHPPMILAQPSSTGAAKTARQKLVKQRMTALNTTPRHPGKIIGANTPPPRTIVTRRFLPK